MKRVCIDPGHGGHDPGAVGGGVKEKDIALSVAKQIGAYLEVWGYAVMLTREDDTFVSLSGRAAKANSWGADLFISVHCNSANNDAANGVEVYHHERASEAAKEAAELIYTKLVAISDLRTRGIKEADFAVLRETKMPAVLVELGFVSNPGDRSKLTSRKWQDRIAKGIAGSVAEVFEE